MSTVNQKLSVIIPCYNEKATLKRLLATVRAAPGPEKEFIVVDDCSRDGTREILKQEVENTELADQVLYHEVNRGKGAALRMGIAAATGEPMLRVRKLDGKMG